MVCMSSKFKYVIFPEHVYQITIDDYDGNPYTFEVTGRRMAEEFRREVLLDRQWNELYNNTQEETDGSKEHY